MPHVSWLPWTAEHGAAVPGLGAVVGHRGAKASAPENTLPGLERAAALGAGWVEFDVMLTRDRVPILIHDQTLQRTTDGTGLVAETEFAELARLDAGAWFAPAFAGTRVPGLAEAIRFLRRAGLCANVEIKPADGHATATGRIVASMLRELWPDPGGRLLVSSFSREALRAARAEAPELARGLLAHPLPPDWEEALVELGCTTLHLDHARITVDELARLVERRVPTLLYTVNDATEAVDLLRRGAAAVVTDVPDVVLSALAQ